MANDYTTSTDAFADIVEANYTATDYPVMASLVTAASRMIDGYLGVINGFFYPTTDDKTYYFDGSGLDKQPIGHWVSITSVAVAESGGLSSSDYTTWTLNTDYVTEPYNATNIERPISCLALVEYAGTKGEWYKGQKSVKVVGVPGWSSTTPDLVKQACKMQSVQWFMKAKQGYQDAGSGENASPMQYVLDENIKAMLKPYILELSA